MTQEIVTIDSEADVRISREAVDPVKGKFSKSNLGRINRKVQIGSYSSCYGGSYSVSLVCYHVLTLSSVGMAQSAN